MPLPTESRRAFVLALGGVLTFAFALRFIVATLCPTVLWPDEIFQSLEQAHRLLWHYGVQPWEFRQGARSWLLPALLAIVMRLTAWMGHGSSGYLAGVRAVLSGVSLAMPAAAFTLGYRSARLRGAVVAGLVTAVWFELVYFAPKALGESVAAAPLVLGLMLLEGNETRRTRTWLVAGVLLGASVVLRVHLGPAVLAAVAVALWMRKGEGWESLVAGLAIPVIIAGTLDAITWGSAFHSYVMNFQANLGGRGALYGTAPWYGYFGVMQEVWGWGGLLIVPLACFGARRAPLTALAAVVTLATHIAFAHKEYRFLLPTIALVLVLAGVGLADGCRWVTEQLAWTDTGGTALAVASLLVLSFASFDQAASYTWTETSLAGPSGEPPFLWHHLRGSLQAFEALSHDDEVCGVGLEARHWNTTGGYTYLHRDVPIFELTSDKAFDRYVASFNVIVTSSPAPDVVGQFHKGECFDTYCVYKRAGGCVEAFGYDLNAEIATHGM